MPRNLLTAGAVICAALVLPGAADRGISFEQRLAAQGVLDRLRHTHQEGTKHPFDQAVPGELAARRVRTQLQESVALEQFWSTPITPEMLQREMERIAASTLFPDRLLEIYAAFDHDPVLVQEALARPALVERLTRSFFATDERIHGEARQEAGRLRERLLLDPAAAPVGEARLAILELTREAQSGQAPDAAGLPAREGVSYFKQREDRNDAEPETLKISLATREYDIERSLAPSRVGEVGEIVEERDSFVIRRLLSEDRTSARIAVYSVPKVPWQTWWEANGARYFEGDARSVARSAGPLPRPSPGGGGERRGRPGRDDPPGTGAPQSACPPDDTWDTRPFLVLLRAMAAHQAVWTGREMLIWGGRQAGGLRYDPLIDTWRNMTTEGAPEKGTAVWADREMILWDGETRSGARYDPVTDSWRPMSAEGSPSPRSSFPMLWTGREVIIWGGSRQGTFKEGIIKLNSGARYDPLTDRWTPIANRDLPAARTGHQMYWTGSDVVMWGGGVEGVRYDPARDRWSPMAKKNSPAAWTQPLVWTGAELLVRGGGQAARYDARTDSWSALWPQLASVIWSVDPLAWTGSEMLFWDFRSRRGGAFNPETGEWRWLSSENAPPPRAGHSVVWTGKHVIVWGGGTNLGSRYDPVTDTWTPTAGPGGPRGRSSHAATWTGNEMIVLDPGQEGPAEGAASRFDPLTSQWRAMPPHPSLARGRSVWTGRELLVYNGEMGGRLDPLTSSWTTMAKGESFPRRHTGHSIVWTGSELLIWGGHLMNPDDDDDHEGAPRPTEVFAYNPQSDVWRTVTNGEWSPTNLVGDPPGRDGHWALWAGTEMFIWGGSRNYWSSTDQNLWAFNPVSGHWRRLNEAHVPASHVVWTGREILAWHPETPARYDLFTDTWTPISTANTPTNLIHQSATWTGTSLLVWGGGSPLTNEGARYDPETDAWTPTSTLNAPAPRRAHSAAWTGRGVIIWGGVVETPAAMLANDGGIYAISEDRDRDGVTACAGDCDDRDASLHPGAVDRPGNTMDEDCNGSLLCDPAAPWEHDGLFVRCVTAECARLVRSGKIPRGECADIIARARGMDTCGNRTIDPHEICDGAVVATTCEGLGFDGGSLYCNLTCDGYNTSACTSACGDGTRRGFETCDGADLGGATCRSLGFDGGSLACHDSCRGFDNSGCTSRCGDGVRTGREPCDGEDFGERACETLGFDAGVLSCSAQCDRIGTEACTAICGDGIRRGLELCDGSDVGDETCFSRGFSSGTLLCNETCDGYDVGRCANCGDGIREEGEVCDRPDLGGETCVTLGHWGGRLDCEWDCSAFEIDECARCGNGWVDGPGEECDGSFPVDSCPLRGFNYGLLKCDSACHIDDSECSTCGDGIRESREGCDGADFGGQTCASRGFDGGSLVCSFCQIHPRDCTTVCGDGIRRGWEKCDGMDMGHYTCAHFGYDDGTLTCAEGTCDAFDTSSCWSSVCGDGLVEGQEECDGDKFNDLTCESLRFAGGTLLCDTSCRADTSACSRCGNRVLEDGELCDRDDVGAATCEALGHPLGGRLRCNDMCDGYETPVCTRCGDGTSDPEERCDGSDLQGRTCETFGFASGPLACNPGCDGFDVSGCTTVCGDGVRHREEECDGGDFSNATCLSFGFTGGLLTCNQDCRLDKTSCSMCGDFIKTGDEECDLYDFGGSTCSSMGFDAGDLFCSSCTIDTRRCGFTCGDGARRGPEVCDGADLDEATCASIGFSGGSLACTSGCEAFDVSACTSVCGDGTKHRPEECDAGDLGGATCVSVGFGEGGLSCAQDCTLDTSGCCGDGVRGGNEQCDWLDLGGRGCTDMGFDGGALRCSSTCSFDTAGCGFVVCGDGVRMTTEVCDGSDLASATCRSLGFDGGTLACGPGCGSFDVSGCAKCGNGVREYGEACDLGDLDGQSCESLTGGSGTLACRSHCLDFDVSGCQSP